MVRSGPGFFPDFIQAFAIDTKAGGGSGFKATYTDFHTTLLAIAVLTRIDITERFLNFLDQLAFPIPRTQFHGELRFLSGAIVLILMLLEIRMIHQVLTI